MGDAATVAAVTRLLFLLKAELRPSIFDDGKSFDDPDLFVTGELPLAGICSKAY